MKIGLRLSIGFICFLSGIVGLIPTSVEAQTVKKCGTTQATAAYKAAHPDWYQIEQAALKSQTQAKTQAQNVILNACSDVKVIPVVFHIIHQNGVENIPDQDVFDAIRILNEDYRLWNEDQSEVVSAFQPVMGEALIEFRLAQRDPSGNATNGIDRIQSSETNVGDDGSKLNSWPRSKYLNIWTVKVNPGGAAAYAYLPAAWLSASVDGIITRYTYVGEGERTLTHEVGHWINLYHVWGSGNDAGASGNCSKDDYVSDTPNCIGTSGGCDLSRTTCSSLDNIQNHMDYASCAVMFTAGQVVRMRAALNSGTSQRNQLSTVSNLMATGVYEGAAQFSTDFPKVCVGNTIQFKDRSYNGICQWNWVFEGGTPATSNERQPPLIVYDNPGSYDVTLTVSNDTGSATINAVDYIVVEGAESLPFFETFTGSSDWLVTGEGGPPWEYTSFTYDGGPGSMAIYNFGQAMEGDMDELISPGIDLSVLESGQITFEVAYAQKDGSTVDILRVYTSGDCGEIWTQSWINGGPSLAAPNGQLTSNFVPNGTGDWMSVTVNLTPMVLTESFRFKLSFASDGGNNIFVDNINISGTYNSTPLLVSPVNYAVDQPTQVVVDWNAVDNVDFYDYNIDTVSSFNSPFLITGTTSYINNSDDGSDTEYLLSALDSSMDIYWQVRTRTGTESSDWSSTWKFKTILTDNGSIPFLISPPNFATDQATQVLLNWNAVDSVDFYDYSIDTVNSFNSPFLITGTTSYISNNNNGPDTEYLLSALDTNIDIYWKVRTRTGTDISDWSSTWKFETILTLALSETTMDIANVGLSVFPNPSSGNVTVAFDLEKSDVDVSVQIFDILGREIKATSHSITIRSINQQLSAGHHELQVNTIQRAGVYYVKLQVGEMSYHSRFTISK